MTSVSYFQICATKSKITSCIIVHLTKCQTLRKEEWNSLRFQIGILDVGRGQYTKFLPHAFTEQGLAMLSGVLNSDIAINVNISIMRAFVSLRQVAAIVRAPMPSSMPSAPPLPNFNLQDAKMTP